MGLVAFLKSSASHLGQVLAFVCKRISPTVAQFETEQGSSTGWEGDLEDLPGLLTVWFWDLLFPCQVAHTLKTKWDQRVGSSTAL